MNHQAATYRLWAEMTPPKPRPISPRLAARTLREELADLLLEIQGWHTTGWADSLDIHRYTEARARARELHERLQRCPEEL